MLIAVGLIQHLCKSKAISHLLQHLRIRSTAGKYSETKSPFSCTTSRMREVPGTSVKAFPIYASAKGNQALPSAFWVLPRGNDGIWSNFT